MRILYSFPHALGAPGIGTTAVRQVLGLLERGHEVDVCAASVHRSGPPVPAKVIRTMVFAGMRLPHRVMGVDRTMAFHDRRVAAYVRRNASRYDAIHCWPGAALDTPRAARQVGGPPVLREVPNTHTANAYEVVARLCAELGIELPVGHSHRMNVGRLRREEAEYEACDGLLVPSDHVLATFLDRGVPREKLLRHQYGFDPEEFTPGEAHDASAPLHALFLGAVEPRKGLHVALQAWKEAGAYKQARLSVYGRVVEEYRPIIAPYLDLPGVKLFEFTDDAAGVLRAADILLLPSFEEGSALVTYEAQGCGAVPVVSEESGAVCVDDVTGLTHRAGDVKRLTSQIARLVEDRGLLGRLRAAVLAQRDELTWAAAAERLEDCYAHARTLRT